MNVSFWYERDPSLSKIGDQRIDYRYWDSNPRSAALCMI